MPTTSQELYHGPMFDTRDDTREEGQDDSRFHPIRFPWLMFPLLRLPAEIRRAILELAINHDGRLKLFLNTWRPEQKVIRSLHLSCRQLYQETAEVVYENIELNWGVDADACIRFFLPQSLPWTMVKSLRIVIQVIDDLPSFETSAVAGIRRMLDDGRLDTLDVVIRTTTLHSSSNNSNIQSRHRPAALRSRRIWLPRSRREMKEVYAFLGEQPFQSFLKLLADPRIATLTVWIEGGWHLDCWCPFHERGMEQLAFSESGVCDPFVGYPTLDKRRPDHNHWPLLELNWKALVNVYLGAEADDEDLEARQAESECELKRAIISLLAAPKLRMATDADI